MKGGKEERTKGGREERRNGRKKGKKEEKRNGKKKQNMFLLDKSSMSIFHKLYKRITQTQWFHLNFLVISEGNLLRQQTEFTLTGLILKAAAALLPGKEQSLGKGKSQHMGQKVCGVNLSHLTSSTAGTQMKVSSVWSHVSQRNLQKGLFWQSSLKNCTVFGLFKQNWLCTTFSWAFS